MPPKLFLSEMMKTDIKQEAETPEKKDNNKKSKQKKRNLWAIKITFVTLILSLVFSFITEITASKANIIIAMSLLLLLVIINIVFDGIGIAAASCELSPLLSMAARKVPGAKIAVILVKNAEKVSNICADVIGDICGIVSGACSITIIAKIAFDNPQAWIFNIILSSLVAAVTVGGKAFIKKVAIKNSKELIMFASRAIGLVYKPKAQK
jgi:hypothetical protein